MKPLTIVWGTIRVRLLAGFAAILLLLAAAGIVGRLSLTSLSDRIANSLASVRRESQLTAAITASASQELSAGARYLEQPDSATENAFRNFGRKSLMEIEALINEKGLHFGMDLSKFKIED